MISENADGSFPAFFLHLLTAVKRPYGILGTQHVNKYLLNSWFILGNPRAPSSLLFYDIRGGCMVCGSLCAL